MRRRLIAASLRRRFPQLGLLAAAVALAAGVATALVSFEARAGARIREDLAAFGPNLLVRPQVGGPGVLEPAELARIRRVDGVERATGVAGPGGLQRVEVRADPGRLEAAAAAIEEQVAGAEARPLLRVAGAEARLERRVAVLLRGIAGLTLLLAALAVSAAAAAVVELRRRELAVLVALGYLPARAVGLLVGELGAAALVAALLGCGAGLAAAEALARRVLEGGGGGPEGTLAALMASVAAAALLTVAAGAAAARQAGRLDPAAVLKGD